MSVSEPVPDTLCIRLVRSPAGRKPRHRRTLAALGLRRVGQTVEQSASPEILGMVAQVSYLVAVEPAAAGEGS